MRKKKQRNQIVLASLILVLSTLAMIIYVMIRGGEERLLPADLRVKTRFSPGFNRLVSPTVYFTKTPSPSPLPTLSQDNSLDILLKETEETVIDSFSDEFKGIKDEIQRL